MSAVDRTLAPVDAVVVGLGWTGSIAALELGRAGLRVVALERGRMQDTTPDFDAFSRNDELRYHARTEMGLDLSRETFTFRNDDAQRALPMRHMGTTMLGTNVGGMGAHWAGETYRNALWDFAPRRETIARYGASAWPALSVTEDWPVGYDELERHYDRFERLCGVSGAAGNVGGRRVAGGNPFEAPRSAPYPNPPLLESHAARRFREACTRLGHHPFPAPAAQASQPYVNPEGATLAPCVYCGMCSRWGCEMGAKASPQTTLLPALRELRNVELRTRANVLRVATDRSRRRATGVVYADADGRSVLQPAELVILASFVFSNTRLMLLSGIGTPYDAVRGTGSVGRSVAYNTLTSVQAFFDDTTFNVFMGAGAMGSTLDDFNADYFDHTGLGFVNGGHISVISGGAGPIAFRPVPPGTPRWGSAWKAAVAHAYNRTVSIAQHGGVLGYRANRIDLDPVYRDAWGQPLARLTFDWHENEQRLAAFLLDKSVAIAREMGAARIRANPLERRATVTRYQTSHHSGGTPFGADRRTSTLNRYLQSWDVPNLFVLGASAFPHSSGNNPTATVGALAYWATEAIVGRYLKRPGALA